MENQDRDKKDYELGVLVASEDDLAGVATLVRQHNAEALSNPRAKKLALAYEIEGKKEAVFAYWNFRAFGEDVKNMERDLNRKAEVMRSLILIAPAPSMEREMPPFTPMTRKPRTTRTSPPPQETKIPSGPLSNEALEKKIEEILK